MGRRDYGNFEVESASLRGESHRRITALPGKDTSPEWSPDGKDIYFVSYRNPQGPGIYATKAIGNGSGLYPIFLFQPFDYSHEPYSTDTPTRITKSPDGSAVALRLHESTEKWGNVLQIVSTDGLNSKRLFASTTPSLSELNGEPAWSLDGQKLAFLYWQDPRDREAPPGCDNKLTPGWSLCIASLNRSEIHSISLNHNQHWNSSYLYWSPDGNHILLTRFSKPIIMDAYWMIPPDKYFPVEEEDERHIVSVNVATDNTKVITPGAYASWSPDGTRIAVIGILDEDGSFLATTAPDGSDLRVLVEVDKEGNLELVDN